MNGIVRLEGDIWSELMGHARVTPVVIREIVFGLGSILNSDAPQRIIGIDGAAVSDGRHKPRLTVVLELADCTLFSPLSERDYVDSLS